jgi:hypothetical protein
MRRWVLFIAAVLSLAPVGLLLAAPLPPIYVINHTTKECSTIMGGDECMDCFPIEGWQAVDPGEGWCPDGYTQVDNVPSRCEHFKDQFCCSEFHSGVDGNCTDLIVNHGQRKCAFVEDIGQVAIPAGWTRGPEDTSASRWLCPDGYEWIDDLGPLPTVGPQPTTSAEDGKPEPRPSALPCPGPSILVPVGLGLVLLNRKRSV